MSSHGPRADVPGKGSEVGAPHDPRRARPDSPASALLDALRAAIGAAHVLVGEEVRARATHFWDPAPLAAGALVRPGSTAEVSAVLALCHAAGQPLVTHGGVTGLVGGDRADSGDVVLSLERLRAIEAIDPVGRTITVEAGCPLERVQEAAREAGLQFGLDLGARGSCTIGGNVSTNAGGLSVLRHGMMREQVLGLEAVLADGTVLSSMNRMLKNNAGYDLKQLFIGSEGTLGVVTRAVLRLRPATTSVQTALVACERFGQVSDLLARVGHAFGGTLNAFEVLWRPFYRLNTDPAHEGSVAAPLDRDHPIYAIVESRGTDPARDAQVFEETLAGALEDGLIVDAAIPQSERERADVWHVREHIDIALRHDPVFVYDVSLPIVEMERYLEAVEESVRARWADAVFLAYGHLADGNLHVLVAPRPMGAPTDDLDARTIDAWHAESDERVYAPLEAIGGSVSAEHGIGLSKKAHLARSRGATEIALMRRLKETLDPAGILNPGKIV